jgi:hypothetical protein
VFTADGKSYQTKFSIISLSWKCCVTDVLVRASRCGAFRERRATKAQQVHCTLDERNQMHKGRTMKWSFSAVLLPFALNSLVLIYLQRFSKLG